MKRICLFILLVAVVSCKSSKTSITPKVVEKPRTELLEGSWQLESMFASDNTWSRAPVINLNLKDYSFSGNSGCNNIRGKFTIKDGYLGFDKTIISTKMACADAKATRDEQAFLAALLKINSFTISKDLLELGQGEIVLMKFKRS